MGPRGLTFFQARSDKNLTLWRVYTHTHTPSVLEAADIKIASPMTGCNLEIEILGMSCHHIMLEVSLFTILSLGFSLNPQRSHHLPLFHLINIPICLSLYLIEAYTHNLWYHMHVPSHTQSQIQSKGIEEASAIFPQICSITAANKDNSLSPFYQFA